MVKKLIFFFVKVFFFSLFLFVLSAFSIFCPGQRVGFETVWGLALEMSGQWQRKLDSGEQGRRKMEPG